VSDVQGCLFQLMPDLSEDEFAALKADIAERGVLVPVEYDELGNILDGHHRVRACEQLGVTDWPRMIRAGMSDDEKAEHALTLNLARRHLSREQRQELVKTLRLRGWSFPRIGALLGVDHTTALRDSRCADAQPAVVTGSDGKQYPATRPTSAFAATAAEQAAVLPLMAEVPAGAVVAASEVTRTPAQVLSLHLAGQTSEQIGEAVGEAPQRVRDYCAAFAQVSENGAKSRSWLTEFAAAAATSEDAGDEEAPPPRPRELRQGTSRAFAQNVP